MTKSTNKKLEDMTAEEILEFAEKVIDRRNERDYEEFRSNFAKPLLFVFFAVLGAVGLGIVLIYFGII